MSGHQVGEMSFCCYLLKFTAGFKDDLVQGTCHLKPVSQVLLDPGAKDQHALHAQRQRDSVNPGKETIFRALKSHLFFSFLPSSLEAGRIMARYGPSTSKKMLFSERVT